MKTQRQSLLRLCASTLLSLAAIAPASALAHGGPPAALGLLAAQGPDAEVILLNEGLALKRPEGWSYICPSLWGEIMLASGKFPLARSADGIATYVPGGEDLFLLRDGELVAQQRPEFRRNALIGLANDSQHVYGLHITTIGNISMSEVVRLNTDGEPRFYPSQEYWGAITADEQGVYIAATSTDQLVVVTLDKEGKEVDRTTVMLPVTLYEVQLHALGGRLYVTGTNGMVWLVGYLEGGVWTELVQDTRAIVGPQTSPDGTLWIALGGALARLTDGKVEPVDETRFITCLEQWNDWHYVCVGSDLHQLTQDGVGERVFEMQGIRATDPKLISPEAQEYCAQQWTLYTIDATRSGLMFVEWPTGAGAAGAGGSAGAASSSGSSAPAHTAGTGVVSAGSAGVAAQAPSEQSGGGCSVTALQPRSSVVLLLFASGFLARFASRARKRPRG